MFSGLLSWLAQFLSAPIIGAAVDAYKAKLASGNEHDKLACRSSSEGADG
jgi:hypothetical protein